MDERITWSGSFFVRCANCRRATIHAEHDGWRFYRDKKGELHGYCPRCASEELPLAWSSPPPVAVCPDCDEVLHPQPRGGWVCLEHGLTLTPKITP